MQLVTHQKGTPATEGRLVKPIEVLLVEDNPADALLTTEALRDALVPYEVHVVPDGEQALTFLHHTSKYSHAPRPHLIILDLNLPRVDGREVLDQIKMEPGLADIPVVVLSSSSNPSDIAYAYRHHAAGYITKPADLDKFFTAIRSLKEFWFRTATFPAKPNTRSADN
jgi:two-component system, chemotaxis family, response regulator Rcp1